MTDNTNEIVSPVPQKEDNKKKFMIPRVIVWSIFLAPFLFLLYLFISVATDIPPMEEIERPQSFYSSEMYSYDGKLLGYIHKGGNRTIVDLDEISPYLINALLVTEDREFYNHSGIGAASIPAIIWRLISTGEKTGASTITMQLARNLYDQIGRKRNASRKIKEVIVAAMIEKNFTKYEILRSYLNTVEIYGNSAGVQTTSKRLFKKNASELSLEESALIVALLKGQGAFSPYKNPEKAKERRDLIIKMMADQGIIEAAKKDSAQKNRIVLAEEMEDKETDLAPYLKERVRLWLEEWGQLNGYNVYRDGLKIYTTIDTRTQAHAEAAVREQLTAYQKMFDAAIAGREAWKGDAGMLKRWMEQSDRYKRAKSAGKSDSEIETEFNTPIKMEVFSWEGEKEMTMSPMDSLKYHSKFLEAGMCAVEPGSGKVKAWVGGINYKYFKYDHVDLSKRQVGSTFKPFVYCAALDNGRTPCDRELNQPVYFYDAAGRIIWKPDNAGDEYGGYITLKKGLEYSLNIITARLTKSMGINVVIDYAHMLGIESPIEAKPASCLGTSDLSVLEMTGAYSTFANNGVFVKPYFISRIEDKDGNLLADFMPEKRSAISPKTAYVMIEMLKGVIEDFYGTGAGLKPQFGLSGEIGGKTGTTQDNSDAWFMGVTSNLVAGTWVGCAERKMRFTKDDPRAQGARMAMPIFGKFMKRVQSDPTLGYPASHFSMPAGTPVTWDCDFEPIYTANADGTNNTKKAEKKDPVTGLKTNVGTATEGQE
jgi:penicillin-binding protein 1A